MKQKFLKIGLICLLILVLTTSLTGCGFAGAYVNQDVASASGSIPSGSNTLVAVWEDKITSSAHPKNSMNGIWQVPLDVDTSGAYGLQPENSIGSLFRRIAVMMYESIFGAEYSKDYFVGPQWDPFSLDPASVMNSVMTETKDLIDSNKLSTVTSAVQGLACGILVVIWALGFIQQIIDERFTIESLLKTLLQLVCGILIVLNATTIVKAFAAAGSALVVNGNSNIGGQFGDFASSINNMLHEKLLSLNIGIDAKIFKLGIGTIWLDFQPIMVILYLAFPLIAMINCAYKIVSKMIMRSLELLARITFAPIPIAFGSQKGFGQDAIRYFRGTLACAAEPVLMLLGCACVGEIASAVVEIFNKSAKPQSIAGITGSIAMGLAYFVLAAYFGETKRMAHEIIGH